jgi:hypothetical protein
MNHVDDSETTNNQTFMLNFRKTLLFQTVERYSSLTLMTIVLNIIVVGLE